MRRDSAVVVALYLLSCAQPSQAQEPQWELLFPDLSGPIAVDPTNSDIIYIASGKAFQSGMWKTTDGGQTWNLYSEGWGMGSPREILINPDNPEEILVGGGPFVGVHKSTDGGQTWFRADSGMVADHHGFMVWTLALDQQRGIFYASDQGTYGGIFRSTDGVHWERMTPLFGFTALDLMVDQDTGVLYAAAAGVWKSSDGGRNWTQISNGLPFESLTSRIRYVNVWHLAKVPRSSTLYAATAVYVDRASGGIYKTVDGGDNWFSVNDSVMARISFRGGLVVAEADTNTVFAGAKGTVDTTRPGGVYLSRSSGADWIRHVSGLPDTALDLSVSHLHLDNRANVLYASVSSLLPDARSEANLYRLPQAVVTSVTEPRRLSYADEPALDTYPNPFNALTTFVCTVHGGGKVRLRLFDILGKEVVTLLDEPRGPGEYRISWDGRNAEGRALPSGIYLATLQVGRRLTTAKVLLLK